VKRGGKSVPNYRVVDPTTKKPLQNRDEQFLDGGGMPLKGLAQRKADEINEHYGKKVEG
jgi:hypothetical protein